MRLPHNKHNLLSLEEEISRLECPVRCPGFRGVRSGVRVSEMDIWFGHLFGFYCVLSSGQWIHESPHFSFFKRPGPMNLSGFLKWCLVVNTCVHLISDPSSLILMSLYEDNMRICSYQQVSYTFGFESWGYGLFHDVIVCEYNFTLNFSESHGHEWDRRNNLIIPARWPQIWTRIKILRHILRFVDGSNGINRVRIKIHWESNCHFASHVYCCKTHVCIFKHVY